MAFKYVIVLCATLAFAKAGLIGAPAALTYSSAPSVSTVYSSIGAPAIATHAAYAAPAIATHTSYAAPALAVATPAIGASHQSTIRSFDGTVSHHSKAVDTAFSSVRKADTRISNNVYSPAIAATYAAPAAPALYASHAAPAVYTSHAAPAVYTSHAAPTVYTSHAAPALYASHPAPAVYSQAAPAIYAAAPKTLAYAASATPVVAHVSFDGLGAHYAW